jgi:hypothetical protein
VVEIASVDHLNTNAAGQFYIGANSAGQSGPSYISAPDCAVTNPTDLALFGFPNSHTVLNVNGCQGVVACTFKVTVNDTEPPMASCPEPITLDRGDKICDEEVQDWLDQFTATDNCPEGLMVELDAPGCGFPAGETTEVTLTAEDAAGNTDTCTSEITIEPFERIDISGKGSFLAFSKIEVLWEDEEDGSGLLKDTFLDITNDYPGSVLVQAYFINGDIEIAEELDDEGNVIQEFEPGWNTADCLFELTGNQPHYWSAANGSDKCQPFKVLDPDGRPANSRILRGYAVFWAVKVKPTMTAAIGYEEIRWNHLKGDAVIVDYAKGTAEEYNAWSAAVVDCVAHGEPPRDCFCRDENGVCCEAEVRPGRLDFDGFQYASGFDELLLDFYGSGSTAFSAGGLTVMLETQLTLHTLGADLRQDGTGPILTKVEAEIWNEFESKFSGTRRCICCWDSTMLSDWARSQAIPNHFTRSALRTDKGKARLDGVESDECDYFDICGREPRDFIEVEPVCKVVESASVAGFPNGISFSHDASLLGISTKLLSFTGGQTEENATSAINLIGMGTERARIRTDNSDAPEELRSDSAPSRESPTSDASAPTRVPARPTPLRAPSP